MGAVSGLLGVGGGAAGTGFAGPKMAPNLQLPTTSKQAQDAYNQAQNNIAQQQSFVNALQGQQGIQNQSQVYNMLNNIAQGKGPNPAQAMLNQATGQNIASQAALMAGQRGSQANPGMMARLAAMQGANTQQQAVGQGATLQAQQALNAITGMGGIAGQQVGQQQQALSGLNQFGQNEQQQLLNSIGQQNSTQAGLQSNINNANASLAGGILGGQQALIGGGLNALGAVMGLAEGGSVDVSPDMSENVTTKTSSSLMGNSAPKSSVGQLLSQLNSQTPQMAKGGKVPALVSPGEKYLSPDKVEKVAKTGINPMSIGETIPGKAKVAGAKDSYKNDIVSKTLEEGGIVLPRSVTQSKNPGHEAKKFVDAILARKGLR